MSRIEAVAAMMCFMFVLHGLPRNASLVCQQFKSSLRSLLGYRSYAGRVRPLPERKWPERETRTVRLRIKSISRSSEKDLEKAAIYRFLCRCSELARALLCI